eukprot:scaffold242196_cov17-Prasinocladus_malaysianus.AAC.4
MKAARARCSEVPKCGFQVTNTNRFTVSDWQSFLENQSLPGVSAADLSIGSKSILEGFETYVGLSDMGSGSDGHQGLLHELRNGLQEVSGSIGKHQEECDVPGVVIVVGDDSSGKSTLINSMIKKAVGDESPAETSASECLVETHVVDLEEPPLTEDQDATVTPQMVEDTARAMFDYSDVDNEDELKRLQVNDSHLQAKFKSRRKIYKMTNRFGDEVLPCSSNGLTTTTPVNVRLVKGLRAPRLKLRYKHLRQVARTLAHVRVRQKSLARARADKEETSFGIDPEKALEAMAITGSLRHITHHLKLEIEVNLLPVHFNLMWHVVHPSVFSFANLFTHYAVQRKCHSLNDGLPKGLETSWHVLAGRLCH